MIIVSCFSIGPVISTSSDPRGASRRNRGNGPKDDAMERLQQALTFIKDLRL
jgi:hypothetical protein